MSIGRQIREARVRAGLSQEELSFLALLDRSYISQLESDRKSPTLDTMFRIADSLGVKLADMVAAADRDRPRHVPQPLVRKRKPFQRRARERGLTNDSKNSDES